MALTTPRISLPNLLSLLDTFASFSGLYVNPTKSKAISINLPLLALATLKNAFPFQWLPSLPYLGFRLTLRYAGLYQANFSPLFRKLSDMLSYWTHLPLSWFGRIVVVCRTFQNWFIFFYFCQSKSLYMFCAYISANFWSLSGAPLKTELISRCYMPVGLMVASRFPTCKRIIQQLI